MPACHTLTWHLASLLLVLGFTADVLASDGAGQVYRGQELFHHGTLRRDTVAARLAGDATPLPLALPCAQCHGSEGEGQREAGLVAPPLRWNVLMSSRKAIGGLRARPAYTPDSLLRAITQGLTPQGGALGAAMPRYILDAAQGADLLAYLRALGTAQGADPGVLDGLVRIATVLPITGPQGASGSAIRHTLEHAIDRVNAAGGIYGRHIELSVIDSHSDAELAEAAVQAAWNDDAVLALLAPVALPTPKAGFTGTPMPVIGPLSFLGSLDGPEPDAVFRILPSPSDLGHCLAGFAFGMLSARSTEPPISLILRGTGVFDHALAEGVRRAALEAGQRVPEERELAPVPPAEHPGNTSLTTDPPGPDAPPTQRGGPAASAIFLFAGDGGLTQALAGLDAQFAARDVFSLAAMVADRAPAGLPVQPGNTWLATPLPPLARQTSGEDADPNTRGASSTAGLPLVAQAATEVLIEGLKRSGRALSRARLIHSLESLESFDTGSVPPISYSRHNHAGLTGCGIVQPEADASGYRVVESWFPRRRGDSP